MSGLSMGQFLVFYLTVCNYIYEKEEKMVVSEWGLGRWAEIAYVECVINGNVAEQMFGIATLVMKLGRFTLI